MALYLNVLPGESLTIGRSRITLEDKTGKRARLRIDSPEDVHHHKAGSPALQAPATPPAPSAPPDPAPAVELPKLRPPKVAPPAP